MKQASAARPATALQLYQNSIDATTVIDTRNNYTSIISSSDDAGTGGPLAPSSVLLSPVISLLQTLNDTTGNTSPSLPSSPDIPKWLYLGPTAGRVTEIVGEAGTGKTQLCLSLCISLVLPPIVRIGQENKMARFDKNHGVPQKLQAIYICMGESAGVAASQIAKRLAQMALARRKIKIKNDGQMRDEHQFVHNILQRIQTKCIYNTEQFLELLHELPIILEQENSNFFKTGVIVLDSIAGLYRTREEVATNHDDKYFYSNRSRDLFYISSQLKKISKQYGVNIVVVNQVTMNGSGRNVPCLGLSWSYCVNERYMLTRVENESIQVDNDSQNSPHDKTIDVRRRKRRRNNRCIQLLASSQWLCQDVSVAAFDIEECGAVLLK
eukprot:CAMPEP_0176482724 /NCGR_PEP_ID=MMETSP0200_2-20121128/3529_1 /TAXON_ID=947934 /ORGANISM="Chaetoceros sp., Strain GSL56" /LENGTH=381 /DNA_ID=CAMNT_0017879061 /DNA_START=16 /DNA_END=1161 /DNA_ORIENTATION=-